MKVFGLVLLMAFGVGGTRQGVAQRGGRGGGGATGGPPQEAKPITGLIPVTDPLVVQKCGSCHKADEKGNLTRISAIRATPEGWEEAIKRMVRLNGLQLTPEEARNILRYLSDTHGLAPEEAEKVQYFAEHRLIDETYPDAETRRACASCHAIAKPLSWRRAPEDWDLLKNMHLAFFPSIQNSFGGGGAGGGGGGGGAAPAPAAAGDTPAAPARQAVDVALTYLKKAAPLETKEWAAWAPNVSTPKLAGTWTVTGYMPGKGKFFGKTKITDSATGYTTHTDISFLSGAKYSIEGTSLVYTGYAWRGRSKGGASIEGIDDPNGLREVMMLSKDQSAISGRWFWGTYQEFGMDVTLHRETIAPAVLGMDVSSLKAGSADTTVKIFGSHLPTTLTPADIALGKGVTVTKIVSATPELVTLTASVDAAATPGPRVISVGGVALPAAFAVYQKMDFLKVNPTTALAHLGSQPHSKGYMQFEAIAYSNGPDDKPNTDDDIALGPVPATWSIEEFIASYGDDDVKYVGKIDSKTGFFTPSTDGPNPERKSMRNNYGDVWSVAKYTPDGAKTALIGKSYFVVGVPQYVQWDQPEVGQ
jgi:quinohemoprotein amine dehydrogenase